MGSFYYKMGTYLYYKMRGVYYKMGTYKIDRLSHTHTHTHTLSLSLSLSRRHNNYDVICVPLQNRQ